MALRRLSFTRMLQDDQAYTPAGAFTSWVTFMEPGANHADGSEGDPVEVVSCWAKIQAVFAQQTKEAQQIVKTVTHLIITPYVTGLDESMFIQFESRQFQIEGIMDPDERHMELRHLCIERDQNAGQFA